MGLACRLKRLPPCNLSLYLLKALASFFIVLHVLLPGSLLVRAQASAALTQIATDQSIQGSLSDQFGVPVTQAVDQAGDLAFIGRGGSALFFRSAGSG